jgi:hypothetical protein
LGPRGRRFKSCYPDHKIKEVIIMSGLLKHSTSNYISPADYAKYSNKELIEIYRALKNHDYKIIGSAASLRGYCRIYRNLDLDKAIGTYK